jgi:hypothetical protein
MTKRRPERVRAQLNALFDEWYWVDWVRSAAAVRNCDQKDILGPALECYRKMLPADERRVIDRRVDELQHKRVGKARSTSRR